MSNYEETPVGNDISTSRKAFMHLSILDELICFRNENIEYDQLLVIRDKCKQLGAGLDVIISNRDDKVTTKKLPEWIVDLIDNAGEHAFEVMEKQADINPEAMEALYDDYHRS